MLVVRKLSMEEVSFSVKIERDDIPFKGNCMASGDDKLDKEVEDWIQDQLERGNDLAWCCILVEARWEDFVGIGSVGGCSYEKEADAQDDIEGLKDEALDSLNKSISTTFSTLFQLIR